MLYLTEVISQLYEVSAKDVEIPTIDILPSMYVMDALRLLNQSYEKFFPAPVKRKIISNSRILGNQIDDWVDKAKEELKEAGVSGASQYIKNIKKFKIVSTKDVNNKWDKKFEHVLIFYDKYKKHLKEIVSSPARKVIFEYDKAPQSAVTLVAQVKRFKLPQEYVYAGNWAFKALKKYDPDLLKEAYKAENMPKTGLLFIKDAITPAPKKEGGPKDITPETHPEYFTLGPEKMRLNKPIKADAKSIKYNPKWNATKTADTVWYAQSIDPSSGERGYHHTVGFMEKAQEDKWPNVQALEKALPKLRKKYTKDLNNPDPKISTIALVLSLMDKGIFRLGNSKSEQDDVRGLHNLLVENVKFLKNNKLKFEYTGKNVKTETITLKVPPKIYALIRQKTKGRKPLDHLFAYKYKNKVVAISAQAVNSYFKKDLGSPASVHKFRHIHSTNMAKEDLLNNPKIKPSATMTKKKKYLQDTIKKIQTTLGHANPSTTLNSYIDPAVIKQYKENMGLTEASACSIVCHTVIAANKPTQLDKFKVYKTIWNLKKNSSILKTV